jgi:L-seryl-tRNA(Ser) seleniumtransferase
MGTGCLVDTSVYGMPQVPTIQDSVAAGADVVTASGDKLLGGPQAGLIVGRRELIQRIRKHPLARAMRIDKLTVAGLEATLRLYVQGRESEIPTLKYLGRSMEEVRSLAIRIASVLKASQMAEGITEVGGGSAPGTGVATWRVGIPTRDPDAYARRLRLASPAIIGRIEDGIFWLDPRTVEEDEIETVCEVLKSI